MIRKSASLMLSLLLPGVLLAATIGAAIGNFRGDVLLNGRAVPPSTAVFPGDKLATGHDGAAYISRPGLTMVMDRESSVQLLGGGARIFNGTAEAMLRPGTVIDYADFHISAASETAKTRIVARPGSEMIGAITGDLKVSDGYSVLRVPQGQALYAKAAAPGAPAPATASPVSPVVAGVQQNATAPAGAITQVASGSLTKMVMTAGAGAAGGVGAYAAVQSSNSNNISINNGCSTCTPVSPSRP